MSIFCVRLHKLAIECFWKTVDEALKPVEIFVVEMLDGTYSSNMYVWLDETHSLLQKMHTGQIGQQMMQLLLESVDVIIVNTLMIHAEMCHPSTGLRLKQIVADIKEWTLKHSMAQAAFQRTDPLMSNIMLHTVEAGNVLLMDKFVFLNRDVLSTFAALGPAQIARILNFFNPDDVSAEPLSPKVTQVARQWAQKYPSYQIPKPKYLF